MTRDDIIRLTKEAGWVKPNHVCNPWSVSVDELERFAALVAAAEREACLALVNQGTGEATSVDALKILRMERDRISAAILARSET